MEPSDANLVQQCLQGDNEGFDALVKRYQKRVYSFCRRMLGDDEAADAAQESFVKAYHALDRFRQDAQFLTWLIKIANNTCIDMSRARRRQRADSLDDVEVEASDVPSNPEKSAIRSDEQQRLWEAVLKLPEKYQTALVMFHFDSKSIKEISSSLGRPEGTVKSDLHVAREMLRRKLEGVLR